MQLTKMITYSQGDCAPGYWCTGGKAVPCPNGTYNEVQGAYGQDACKPCPAHSSTRGEAKAHRTACECVSGYFDAGDVICSLCPLGADCTLDEDERGLTIAGLPVARGFFRTSFASADIRRCPDASANCSASSCLESTTGCLGTPTPCRAGLTGIYCRQCEDPLGVYYASATSTSTAECRACASEVGTTLGFAALLVWGLLAAVQASYFLTVPP